MDFIFFLFFGPLQFYQLAMAVSPEDIVKYRQGIFCWYGLECWCHGLNGQGDVPFDRDKLIFSLNVAALTPMVLEKGFGQKQKMLSLTLA